MAIRSDKMKRIFHCPWLFTREGWRQDRLLEVDNLGFITAVAETGTPTRYLAGPVIPGMANVHSHAHQRVIAGLTGQRGTGKDSFWSWREQMYRALAVLDPGRFRAVAAWLFAELLEGGYTSLGEFHYLHRADTGESGEMWRALVEAAADTGMNLTLLPVWYRYSGFGRQAPAAQQAPFIIDSPDDYLALVQAMRRAAADLPGVSVGMAPHSLRAVDVDDLPALAEAVPDGPIHIHVSEQTAEVDACRKHTGTTPIRLLHDRVGLDGRWCLIHATHADAEEIGLMAETGSVVGICPTTEADLGDGLFMATEFVGAGGRLGIGSDSNLRTSASEELRLLEWSQRYRRQGRNLLTEPGRGNGEWLWRHTTEAGHQAIGQPGGVLESGKRADFLVLDADHPLLAELAPEKFIDCLVFAGQPGMIDQTWTAGQLRVDGGRYLARELLLEGWTEARRALSSSGK